MSTNVLVTVVNSQTPPTLTKVCSLDPSGNVTIEPSAQMTKGEAKVVSITSAFELAQLISKITTSQAMIWGIPKDMVVGDTVSLVSSKKYHESGSHTLQITRTKDHFQWAEGAGVLMLDFDFKHNGLTKDNILKIMQTVIPNLEQTAYVWWCSSSSYLYKNDEEFAGLKGQRLYLLVKKAQDIERVGRVIFQRLWLLGHGSIEVSKSGSLLMRTLIDSNVWQPNRLDFISGAKCIAPMRQNRPLPDINEGPFLDTEAFLPDLTPDECLRLKSLQEQARQGVADLADIKRKKYIQEQAKLQLAYRDLVCTDELLDQEIQLLTESLETKDLYHHQLITLADGKTISVEEVLLKPQLYNECLTLDPLEPDYDGGRLVGILYLQQNKPILFSQAHGGQSYQLISKPVIRHDPSKDNQTVNQIMQALKKLPQFYIRADQLVYIRGQDLTVIKDPNALAHYIAEHLQFQQYKNGRWVDINPPKNVITTVLSIVANKQWQIKPIMAVINTPLITLDNHIVWQQGYDQSTGLYLLAPDSIHLPPERVNLSQAKQALDDIMEVFDEFPFETNIDKSVCLTAILTAVVRPILNKAPAFAFDAPKQGTGKTYLAQCIALLGLGEEVSIMASLNASSDDETRKRIMAELIKGSNCIIWDNVMGKFDSATMASLITSSQYSDRILGKTENLVVNNRVLILITGNNIQIAGELPRRVFKCRLDSHQENPIGRVFTKDALNVIRQQRSKLVRAVLMLIRASLQNKDAFKSSIKKWHQLHHLNSGML